MKIRIVFNNEYIIPKTYICDSVEHNYENNIVHIKNAYEIRYSIYDEECDKCYVGDVVYDFRDIFYYGTTEETENDKT